MNRQPGVGMISNTYYSADPRLRRQAEALAAHGYQVEVLCQRQPGEEAEEDVSGVQVRRIGGLKYSGRSLRSYLLSNATFFLRAFVALTCTQIRYGYAAVQVYSMPEALILSALVPRLAGVPLIYDAGDLTAELCPSKFGTALGRLLCMLLRAQERVCLGLADLIVTVHEEYRRRLLARGVSEHRLHVTMNLPDPRLIDTALKRRTPRDSAAVFTLVHHGTLVERYGADLAMRAVARLRERMPSLRLHIYGDGDMRPRLVALIDELGLGDAVMLHPGWMPLQELLPLLASADAAIVPHRADAFTDTILPNKLLEYLALGLPTVVTRTRTVQWHIPEDTVEYCAPNDVQAMACAIERLWAEPGYRASLAARARAFSQQHSWSDAAVAYCVAVDTLITQRTTTRAIRHSRHS